MECFVHLVITHLCQFHGHGAVSHSSTEAEVISLDTVLRMEGLLALTLWDIVTDVLEPRASRASGDLSRQLKSQSFQNDTGNH